MSSGAPLTMSAAAPPSTMVPSAQLCSADRSSRPKQRHRRQRQDPAPCADAAVASEQRLFQLCYELLRKPLQQPAQPQARQREAEEKEPPKQLCSTGRGTNPRQHRRQQRQDPAPRADAAAASEQRLVQLCHELLHEQIQQPADADLQVRQREAEEKAQPLEKTFPNSANNLAQLCRKLILQQGQHLRPGSDAALQPHDISGPPGRWHTVRASSQVGARGPCLQEERWCGGERRVTLTPRSLRPPGQWACLEVPGHAPSCSTSAVTRGAAAPWVPGPR